MVAKRYPEIAQDLARRIDAGEFGEDRYYQLPSETALVKYYNCSSRTVIKFIGVLEARGYIESIPSVGRFLSRAKIKQLEDKQKDGS